MPALNIKPLKGESIGPFTFKFKGSLPGMAAVKLYISKDWADQEVAICRYSEDNKTYGIVTKVIADSEGYVSFKTDKNNNYFAALSIYLPKTGGAHHEVYKKAS